MGEKLRARRTMRGLRNVIWLRSGAWAWRSASASSTDMVSFRALWKRAYCSASDSGRTRLAMAAYLIAVTSTSGFLPYLSSAMTSRPSEPSPTMTRRSRGSPGVPHCRSTSKVMILMAGPRISGFERTHSCRSARSSRPASSSEIICAGIATDPATVKRRSSAMSVFRLRQTPVRARGDREPLSHRTGLENGW